MEQMCWDLNFTEKVQLIQNARWIVKQRYYLLALHTHFPLVFCWQYGVSNLKRSAILYSVNWDCSKALTITLLFLLGLKKKKKKKQCRFLSYRPIWHIFVVQENKLPKDLLTHLAEVISKSWGRWCHGQILHCFRGVLICIYNWQPCLAVRNIFLWLNRSVKVSVLLHCVCGWVYRGGERLIWQGPSGCFC